MDSLHAGDSIAGKFLRRRISMETPISNRGGMKLYLPLSCRCCGTRWFRSSDSAESTRSEFSGRNAYELLGVSETSSFAEIKASFRRLAKLTHPDLAESSTDSDSSEQFVQILAAYEILSDSEKRGHYDMYLLSQRKLEKKKFRDGVRLYTCESRVPSHRQMEVAEWLKWYRFAIREILLEKRVVDGNGYFDELERDFYSAVRQAYYGPAIGLLDFLPDRFEAEERSVVETPELLHLVSGRDLFGMVCLTHKVPELAHRDRVELESSYLTFDDIRNLQTSENVEATVRFNGMDDMVNAELRDDSKSQAFSDLELQVYGRAVAVSTRVPPKNDENDDRIDVYLNSDEYSQWGDKRFTKDSYIGSIKGLRTSPDEGSCFVYNNNGSKTHVIVKHRTLLVKHMHWYGVGEEVSACECRCSRAKLPPSKFWLFEPRCVMHDIGGWYIETFGRDKKGRSVLSQRYWDGFDPNEQSEKRLHPAMYLLALAYRTLDLEDARLRKRSIVEAVERKLFRILGWCKKLI